MDIAEKMKMSMNEPKSIIVMQMRTQISAFLLYQGVYCRFSQMISLGSEAS